MEIIHVKSKSKRKVIIGPIDNSDYRKITKSRYWFDWRTEKDNLVYKLCLETTGEILGLMSLIHYKDEKRFELHLLAVSKENRGKEKVYKGIAGSLIAYACRKTVKLYAINGCVSLIPKTELKAHYMKTYGMLDAGRQLFLEGRSLLNLLNQYEV